MRKFYLILAAAAGMTLASCTSDTYLGDNSPTNVAAEGDGSIQFGLSLPNTTRAGELKGATAAEKLGKFFVVEGTKGSEATDAPSSTVVFDNYLVGYEYNSAGTQEDNTHNWEYVGKEAGITGKMTSATWTALHPASPGPQVTAQTIKYWDYSTSQYDFIAWSTGAREAVTTTPTSAGTSVQVTRISTGTTLATNGFQMTALSADDLKECYYTDITTVTKASGNYQKPVTLTFRNMAAKVRVALYETVPGYSVQGVEFYQDGTTALTADVSSNEATLYTATGAGNELPQSGTVTVLYPRIGSDNSAAADYNKASVTVSAGTTTSPTQTFGSLTGTIGTTLPTATFAGAAADNYYTAVIPNTDGKPLTLRVNYTLVSTDGSNETIKVYGAKAVVPATYTNWLPNYAYTYIFKISDNSKGWTSQISTDPEGLHPITFDAVVTSFVDVNAGQTTVTTVATPSITTYQQGHYHPNKDEYSKSQKAGADQTNVKDLYVQVMDNSGATPTPKNDLYNSQKSRLFSVSKANASEAEVMDALKNRTNVYNALSPIGRNGITLTKNDNITNTATTIVNGVDDQPITGITSGTLAKIDIDQLDPGTYAYVYCTTVPSSDEKVYNVVSSTTASGSPSSYYEVATSSIATTACAAGAKAAAGKVYFVKTTDAVGGSVTYTFKQTKVNDEVEGLYEATIPDSKAGSYTEGNFYFDVYNQNNGAYAVKVIKVVD